MKSLEYRKLECFNAGAQKLKVKKSISWICNPTAFSQILYSKISPAVKLYVHLNIVNCLMLIMR
jgi:hypothetical protein